MKGGLTLPKTKRKTPILRLDRERALKLCRVIIKWWQTRSNDPDAAAAPQPFHAEAKMTPVICASAFRFINL